MDASWGLRRADDPRHRSGQMKVLDRFNTWILNGCPTDSFSVNMATRYGKSDAIRNIALLAIRQGICSRALVVTTSRILARQLLESSRLDGWNARWEPYGPNLHNVARLDDFAWRSMCNDEWLGAIHIQALMQPMQMMMLEAWITRELSRTGKAPLIIFDEAQQFSTANRWGDIARRVKALGCRIVVLTATPFRHDGDDIVGFRKRAVSESETRKRVYVTRHDPDPDQLELHTVTRDETEFEIEADVEVSFADAWKEGVLAKVTFDLIDPEIVSSEGVSKMLSELSESELRKGSILPRLYRDPDLIDVMVQRATGHLLNVFRSTTVKDATMIVYGMDDMAGEENANQNAILKSMKRNAPSLRAKIATMQMDMNEGVGASEDLVTRFTTPGQREIDALILKQMGGAGLDSDQICVVVLWNTTRSLGQMIQMAMRGGNVAAKKHFYVVGLCDAITNNRLRDFCAGNGGTFIDAVETDHEVELIDRTDEDDLPVWTLDKIGRNGVLDNYGNELSALDREIVRVMLQLAPELGTIYTEPQLSALGAQIRAVDVTDQSVALAPISDADTSKSWVNTSEQIAHHRDAINRLVKKIGKRAFAHLGCCGDAVEEHVKLYRQTKTAIKKRSGRNGTWSAKEKNRSQSLSDYEAWKSAAELLHHEIEKGSAEERVRVSKFIASMPVGQ